MGFCSGWGRGSDVVGGREPGLAWLILQAGRTGAAGSRGSTLPAPLHPIHRGLSSPPWWDLERPKCKDSLAKRE